MNFNIDSNASYNFVAPNITADEDLKVELTFPTRRLGASAFTANALTLAVTDDLTIRTFATEVAAAATLTVEAASHLNVGARLLLKFTFGSTKYDITVKTGSTTDCVLTGVASTTVTYELVWTGTAWLHLNA